MKHFACLLFICAISTCAVYSQTDSVNVLREVRLFSTRIKDSLYTANTIVLSDSTLQQNQASLTSLLNYNSPIYFKENGLGMVSSPSFRGTTATQTAVLWNGITINSQTTGQTDFNTINTRGFNKIEVQAGGAGVAAGSGAIGGTINLVNELRYNTGFTNNIFINYGSYNTYGVDYETNYATKKLSLQLGLSRNASDNNYPFPNTNLVNSNGQYHNTNVSFASGLKINENNSIKFLANVYDGRRNFSVPNPNALRTKYTDFNTRSLIELQTTAGSTTSTLKLATTTEKYQYFANANSDVFSLGNVNSFIAHYNLDYSLSRNILISAGAQYTHNDGNGSNIEAKTRNLAAATLRFKHAFARRFLYEIGLRQETNAQFGNPLLYSAGFSYQALSFYKMKVNTSKNFRIPTYNDLYWTSLGNPNLKPEISYQGEFSNVLSFNNVNITLTGYYNAVTDLLRYIPDPTGVFRPENTNDVQIYGIESLLSYNKQLGSHNINFQGTYAYTVSENQETNKQLTYVPFHKATASAAYNYKNVSVQYQFLYNGEVFTTTDNASANTLNSYTVANAGITYTVGSKKNYSIGAQVLNIWNESYENVLNRPLPGTNFTFNITLKL